MDKIIQSRINRSLVIHGLENLVFEKRQRKSIQQFTHIIPNNSQEQKLKKIQSDSNKKAPKPIRKVQTSPKKQSKPPQKKAHEDKGQIKKKQSKRKLEQSEQEQVKRQVEPIACVQAIKNTTKTRSHKKITIPDKKINPEENKKDLPKKQISQKPTLENKDEEKNMEDETNNFGKRYRGKPKKDFSQTMKIIEEQPPKEELIPVLQIVPNLITTSLPPSHQNINQEMNAQSASDGEKEMAAYTTDKINPRDRRAKMNPYKSYNQNDDEFDEEESYQQERSSKKKKKISKNSKGKNGNKPYSLNRIFRKEAKRHFSTFTLDLDFNKASFSNFAKEFGMFDLIHFSLPISYLNLFPEVINIIQKGFIFVWVQQGETPIGYHLLNRWGFDIIDQLIWIKANEDENKIEADNVDICNLVFDKNEQIKKPPQQLFINSKSTCLVGYKCPLGNKAEYRTKVSNNIIFAKSLEGLKKPSQIYEIADLMMPGAKKLEFGGDAQKGWLNLRHHERTLYRCHVCLREQKLYILLEEKSKPIQCKKCIINDLKIDLETEQVEVITNHYQSLNKIKVAQINFIQEQKQVLCRQCKKSSEQFEFDGLILPSSDEQGICLGCLPILQERSYFSEVKIQVRKQQKFMNNQMTCSDCGILNIYDVYFQCGKCKNHIICKNCFWKDKSEDDLKKNALDDTKKLVKKDLVHQWKLKFIKTMPLMKFTCFGCKSDLSIPFWCCETCQNWFWCGKCDRGDSDIHPHYQTTEHVEYLMI